MRKILFIGVLLFPVALWTACISEKKCYPTGPHEGCYKKEVYDLYSEAPPVRLTPTSATLAVGHTQVFEINGGKSPLYMRVVGCLGDVIVCNPTSISSTQQAFPPAFRVEKLARRTVAVTFIDATFRPRDVFFEAWGSNGWGKSKKSDTLAYASLNLVY